MHKVAIGFTFYKQFEYSDICLQSILDSDLGGIDYEIVLSNNACPEHSDKLIADKFSDKFENFKIVQNGENKGCSGGWNAVINNSDSEYVWILNNDVVFHPLAIKNVIDFMKNEPDALIVSPAILEYMNPEVNESLRFIHNKMQKAYEKLSGNVINTWTIISACAKKEVYTDIVGFFDENFLKAFYEDADFGNRCREKGICGFTTGNAINYHYGSRTVMLTSRWDPTNCAIRNSQYFNVKWQNGFISGEPIEKLAKQYNSFDENMWKQAPVVNIEKI